MSGPDQRVTDAVDTATSVDSPGRGTGRATDRFGRAPDRPRKRPLTRRTKILTTLILILSLVEGGALVTRYFLTDHRWVIVDNAQVAGDRVEIRAPMDGRVVGWDINTGSTVDTGQIVGRVEILGQSVRPRMSIKAPGHGTVAQNTVFNGMYVTAGSLLATAYDLGGVYINARVPEAEMHDVHLGAAVDVLSDAYADTPMSGTVSQISGSSAGVNELSDRPNVNPYDIDHPIYPDPDIDPQNPQEVKQYIPVRIDLDATDGARITPGQSVVVHIHRH